MTEPTERAKWLAKRIDGVVEKLEGDINITVLLETTLCLWEAQYVLGSAQAGWAHVFGEYHAVDEHGRHSRPGSILIDDALRAIDRAIYVISNRHGLSCDVYTSVPGISGRVHRVIFQCGCGRVYSETKDTLAEMLCGDWPSCRAPAMSGTKGPLPILPDAEMTDPVVYSLPCGCSIEIFNERQQWSGCDTYPKCRAGKVLEAQKNRND